jgi:hypothetical protein
MSVPQMSPLSIPPTRQDPVAFDSRAGTFLSEPPDFAIEANAIATFVNTKTNETASSASTASTQAGIATTKANESSASATLSQNWASKTDAAVAGGEFSAKYHAQAAQALVMVGTPDAVLVYRTKDNANQDAPAIQMMQIAMGVLATKQAIQNTLWHHNDSLKVLGTPDDDGNYDVEAIKAYDVSTGG